MPVDGLEKMVAIKLAQRTVSRPLVAVIVEDQAKRIRLAGQCCFVDATSRLRIQENDPEVHMIKELVGLFRRFHGCDPMASRCQQRRQHFMNARFTIDDQKLCFAPGGLASFLERQSIIVSDIDELDCASTQVHRTEQRRRTAYELNLGLAFNDVQDAVDPKAEGSIVEGNNQDQAIAGVLTGLGNAQNRNEPFLVPIEVQPVGLTDVPRRDAQYSRNRGTRKHLRCSGARFEKDQA